MRLWRAFFYKQMLLSLKDIQEYGNLELLAQQVVEGYMVGRHKSPFHGFSVEFAEHRLYNKGEDTRHIDWKVFARTDKLFVKRYEEETNLRCHILVDESSSMYFGEGEKMRFSLFSSAVLLYILRKQRDAAGLSFFSDKLNLHIAAKSSAVHIRYLYGLLEGKLNNVSKHKMTSLSETIHQIADKIPRRSMVVLFSDMFDNNEKKESVLSALKHLRHNKHEVVVFHVLDTKKELNFEFENRPYLFEDMETGEKVKLHPSQVKELYQKQMKEFLNEMKLRCGQYNIEFVPVDVQAPFAEVLLPFFVKRKKMP